MPSKKISSRPGGAPAPYTEDGPPERMSAPACRRRESGAVNGINSAEKPSSRTLLAISWAYSAPKSMTRTWDISLPEYLSNYTEYNRIGDRMIDSSDLRMNSVSFVDNSGSHFIKLASNAVSMNPFSCVGVKIL